MAAYHVHDTGMAVFLPLRGGWLELRAANKQAVLAGKAAQRFFITGDEQYYRDFFVAQILESDQELQETLAALAVDCTGCSEKGIHCAALFSTQSGEGVLIHREESGWIYAWLPLLTARCVEVENCCAEQLHCIAHTQKQNGIDRKVCLSRETWNVTELLEAISTFLRST